jgi:hypothetical protein
MQAVVAAVAILEVVGVVLVESSTGPTTQSHLAHSTPLLSAKGGQGDSMLMVPMGMTPPSLARIHRQA